LKDLKAFTIEILKLSNKKHAYEFESGSSFFDNFEQSLIEKGTFKVHVDLDKSETMLQLYFHIVGTVGLICDRTLEPFDFPLDIHQKLILKFGEQDEQLTDEIEIISRNTPQINVAQYIYEFIGLAIPMKKLHPKLAHADYQENEEGILVYSSQTAPDESESLENGQGDEPADPRFDILKKLK
jgi:uncharacterized metal-binding protein YceD (DUF177 family)